MSMYETIKRANLPGPPEHSIALRVSSAGAVVVSIAACWAQGELSGLVASLSIVLIIVGNVFSYLRRERPFPFLKIVLAAVVVASFLWFFTAIAGSAEAKNLAGVEGPLAVLFTLIQVAHAFDVPSRRDLGFTLAGSATLMAVAGAQAVDTTFALYVVLWAAFGLTGLLSMWSSMSGGSRIRPRSATLCALAVVVLGVAVLAALPAPHATNTLVLPSSLAGDVSLSTPAGLVGGGPRGDEPVRAGSPSGPTRVGGFLGFAGPLNTAVRGALGQEVVFRVRADRPSFWLAETFDRWTGQSWDTTNAPGAREWTELQSGSPFSVPLPGGEVLQGTGDYQTFYLAVAGPNLIFHAANANQVWFPARRIFVGSDGTMRAGTSMGPGSIYTVLSTVNTATPSQLATASPSAFAGGQLTVADRSRYLQLPHSYRRVAQLAQRITTGATTVYAKINALEHWLGTHTQYTTDIPPLTPGQDTVNQFLFVTRRGYCEQISTSLAVMLRTLGIPAREATGYVPGPYNPLTDLYEVQAKDAHAWVQVWFPGYGWQSFDPTAFVPDANPSPAQVIGHDLLFALRRIPTRPVGLAAVLIAGALAIAWLLRRRPESWAAAVSSELEHAARRAGLEIGTGQPLLDIARRLDARWPPPGPAPPNALTLAVAAERAAYLGVVPDVATRRRLLRAARRLRRGARRLRPPRRGASGRGRDGGVEGVSPATAPTGGPAPPGSSTQPRATAGTP